MAVWNPRANDLFLQALEVRDSAERQAFVSLACGDDAELCAQVQALLLASEKAGSFLERPALAVTSASAPGEECQTPQPVDTRNGGPERPQLGECPDTEREAPAGGAESSEGPGAVIGPYRLLHSLGEGGMGTVYLAEQEKPVRRQVALKVIRPGMDTRQVIARFEAERQALALMDHPNIAKVFDGGETASGLPYFVMELVQGVPLTKYCDEHYLTVRERLELFIPVCQAVQHAHTKGVIHRDLKPSNVLVALRDGRPVAEVIDFGVAKATGPKLTEQTLHTEFGAIVGTLEYMSPEQAEPNNQDVDTRSDIYALGVLLYELLTGTTPLQRKRLKEVSLLEVLRLIREEEPPKPSTRLSTADELALIAANRCAEPKRLSGLVRGELDWIVMKCLEKDRTRRYETANGLARDIERYLHDEPVEACPPSAGYKLRKFARKYRKALATAAAFVLVLIVGVVVSIWLAVRATEAEGEARQAEGVALEETKKAQGAERDATIAQERAELEAEIKQAVHTFVDEDLLGQADVEAQVRPDRDVKVRTLLDRASAAVESGRFKKQPEVEAAIRLTIGNAYRATGEYDKARPHLERCLEIRRRVLPAKHPDTLIAINSLAYLYFTQPLPHRAKAEALLVEAVKASRGALGDEHPITLTALHNAALFYLQSARSAEPLLIKVVDGRRRVLGAEHRDTLRSQLTLAQLYHTRGKADKAQPLYEKTLETSRRALGAEHPRTLLCMNGLATLYMQLGEYARAEPLYLEALEGNRRVLGNGHANTLMVQNNLLDLYLDQRQYLKAERLAVEALNIERTLKEDHGISFRASSKLMRVYEAQGGLNLFNQKNHAESELVLRKLLDAPSPGLKYHTLSLLGEALAGQQKYAEAEPPLLAGYEGLKAVEETLPTTQRRRPVQALERVVQLYQDWDKPARAAEWRAKLIQENRRQARRNDTHASLDRARALASQGKLADAETVFRAVVRSEPDRPEVHRALGEFLCYRKHDHDGAVAAFREAVRLQPENPVNQCGLGNALSRKGERAAAKAAYREALRLRPGLDQDVSREARVIAEETEAREALRLKPNSAKAHLGLVSGLLKQGKLSEAEAECREAVRLEPDSVEAHCALGRMLWRYGIFHQAAKEAEAEAEFRKALRLKPDSLDALLGLGDVLFSQGLDSKILVLSMPLRFRPGDADTEFDSGSAEARGRKLPEAEEVFRKAMRLKPDSAEAHAGLAKVLSTLGKSIELEKAHAAEQRRPAPLTPPSPPADEGEERVRGCREAVRLKPDYAVAHFDLGRALVSLGKWAEAESAFRQAIRLKPDYAEAHRQLGALLSQNERDQDWAIAAYREAIRLAPNDVATQVSFGKLLLKQGQPPNPWFWLQPAAHQSGGKLHLRQRMAAEAEAAFRTALRLKPDELEAVMGLGNALIQQDKLAEAEAEFRKILRLRPDLSDGYQGLAAVLQRKAELAQAEAEARDAARLKPAYAAAHVSAGNTFRKQGRLAEAEAAYREAIRIKPDFADAYSNLGALLGGQRGDLDGAVAAYREALRLQPKSATLHCDLGRILLLSNKPAEAEAAFREAIRLDKDFTDARLGLGSALAGQGKLADAETVSREVVRLQPKDIDAHEGLSKVLRKRGDKAAEAEAEHREALRLHAQRPSPRHPVGSRVLTWVPPSPAEEEAGIREAIRLKPVAADVRDYLAWFLVREERPAEAEAELREALRLQPDYAEARDRLVHVLLQQRRPAEAEAVWREAVRLQLNDANVHHQFGTFLFRQGKMADAETEFREALRINKDHTNAHLGLGDILARQNKPVEAEAEYRNAVRLEPKNVVARFTFAFLLSRHGKQAEAEAEYREVVRLQPDYALAHNNLGVTLQKQRKWGESELAFRAAVRLRPDYAFTHCYLGDVLAEQGKWAAAEAAYREALHLQKNHTEANAGLRNVLTKQNKLYTAEGIRLQREEAVGIYNRGNALLGQRKLDEAIDAYRKALALDPDYPEAHCNLGHTLRNKGRFAEALVELKKGHELGSKRPNWSYHSAQWVTECERLVALDARLPAILKGEAKAKDWNEQFGFANLCTLKQLHAAAARLYQEGLTAYPERTGFRFSAASAAALASCGSGDAAQLDDKERSRWRKEALGWLRTDLEMWRKALERNTPQARRTVQGALGPWKSNTNLAGLREAAALAKLPAAEREAWQKLWAEVEALLQQSRKNQP